MLIVPTSPESVAEPRRVAPSKKFTVPVTGSVVELTVAVNVTDCPNEEGLGEDARTVVVAAGTLSGA